MPRATVAATAAVILLLAGCAEESDPSLETAVANPVPRPADGAEPTPDASDLAVLLSDSAMSLSAERVPTGAVSLHVRNAGTTPHALSVRGERESWSSLEIAPGDSVTMSLPLAVGRYVLFCPLNSSRRHEARERARLTVD